MILKRRYLSTIVPLSLFATLIILTTVIMISRAFTSLPYYDSWGLYPEAIPSFEMLFHGHNEHVIATIRAFFWLDRFLTSSSGLFTIGCIFLSCAIPSLVISLIVHAHGKEYDRRPGDGIALVMTLLCLGYAGIQFTNFVWQFQIGLVSAYTLSLTALGCQAASVTTLRRNASWAWLFAALLFAVLASYGLFGGTLVWPAMAAFAWLGRRRRHLAIIVTVGAIVAIPYIINLFYTPPSHGIGEGKVLKFLLAWLGSPMGAMLETNYLPIGAVPVRLQVGVAAFFGLLTIVAFAYLSLCVMPLLGVATTKKSTQLLLPLWLFCWIVLLSGLLAALGRSYLPLNEAISSRYTTPSLALWACMLALWLQLARMGKINPRFFRKALLIASTAVLASQPNKVFQSNLHGARMAEAESASLNEVPDLSAMAAVYPTPETIISHLGSLKSAKVSIFRPGAWPALGDDTKGWNSNPKPCRVKVSVRETSFGKIFWRAELTAPSLDSSWRVIYVHNGQIVGLGAPEDRRGIHLIPSEMSHWIGYAPTTFWASHEETFAVASAEDKAISACMRE